MFIFSAKSWNIMSKVLFGISIVPILVAIGFWLHTSSFLETAVTAEAEIIELIPRNSNGSTLFAPVYLFEDANGNEIKKYSSFASYPPLGVVGEKIDILYSPENPKKSRLNTFFSKWGVSAITGGLGIFYLMLSAIGIFFTSRRLKQKESESGEAGNA